MKSNNFFGNNILGENNFRGVGGGGGGGFKIVWEKRFVWRAKFWRVNNFFGSKNMGEPSE